MAIEPFNTRMRIRKSSLGSGRVMVDPRRGLHVYDLPRGLIKLWKNVASGCCFKVFLCAGGCLKVLLGSCFCTPKILNWWYFFAFFYGNHRSTNDQPLCDSPLYPQPAPCHGLWHISRDDGVLQVVGGVLEQVVPPLQKACRNKEWRMLLNGRNIFNIIQSCCLFSGKSTETSCVKARGSAQSV